MECHECGATISEKAADCPHCGTSVSDAPPADAPPSEPEGQRGSSEGGRPGNDSASGVDEGSDGGGTEATTGEQRATDPSEGGETSTGSSGGEQPSPGERGEDRGAGGEPTGADPPAASDEASADSSAPGDAGRDASERASGDGRANNPAGGQSGGRDGPESARQTAGQSAAGSGDQSAGGVAGRAPERGSGQPTGQTGGRSAGQANGQSTGQANGQTTGQANGPSGGQGTPQPAGQTTGKAAEQGGGPSAGQTAGRAAGGGRGQRGGRDGGQPGGGGDPSGGHGGAYGAGGGSVDLAALLGELPLFPGAAAGFASAVVAFGVAVAVAAVMPTGADSTLGLGAVVFFDLHFATPAHVTPFLYGVFEVVRPPDAALGLLYLLAPGLLYTAAKLVVTFNGDEGATLAESALAGATVLVGYLPVAVVAFLAVPSTGPGGPSAVTAIFLTGVLYPFLFGALGGVAVGGFASGERRIGTVYALGVAFFLVVGVFLTTFLSLSGSTFDVDLLTRVLVTLFSVAGMNALSLGQGQASSVLPFVFAFGVFGVAGFLRAWRAAPLDSPVDGARKGVTLAFTYAVVAGVLLSALPVFADPYIQEQVGMSVLASAFVETVVRARLETVGQYASAVFQGTLVYPVILGGTGGAIAAAIRDDERGSPADR